MNFNLVNELETPNKSILDHLPTDDRLQEWFTSLPVISNQNPRIIWKASEVQSPDTYTTQVTCDSIRFWIKFSLPNGVTESQVYQDLALSPLYIPNVIGSWEHTNFHCVLLSDLPGINLMQDPAGAFYLPLATQQLALLQHWWNQKVHQYDSSSFSYLNSKDEIFLCLGEQALQKLSDAWELLDNVPIFLTHGDSIPANWIHHKQGVSPIDFKEVTLGHCLLDLIQLIDPVIWSKRDPNGDARRSAVYSYTSTITSLGYEAPWVGNEDTYLRAAWIVNQGRMQNWLYRQRLKWYAHPDKRIHPFFKADPHKTLQNRDAAILRTTWDSLF